MQVRRQVSPLLTLALLFGAVGVFRQSPWIREAQGRGVQPRADFATSAETVATLTPMVPPGFKPPSPTQGNSPKATAAALAQPTPLVKSSSSLQLANPQVAENAHLAPQRQEQITQKLSRLNAETEQVMRQAIQEWRQRGGVATCQMPDFQSVASPHRREIENLTRRTEREIAQLLTEEEFSRWQAMQAPAQPIERKKLFPALVE